MDLTLDKNQEKVLQYSGNVQLTACAGGGKTRTIIAKVKSLLDSGVWDKSILLLTFTNKAADEMIERLNTIYGKTIDVSAGTIHHFGATVLRLFAPYINIPNEFTILDETDVKSLVRSFVPAQYKKTLNYRLVCRLLDQADNMDMHVNTILESDNTIPPESVDLVRQICEGYINYKKEHYLLSFGDLLTCLRRVLEVPKVLSEITRRFKYILIDEYQDINPIQEKIFRLLDAPGTDVISVGDSAQSIYGFRQATPDCILNFQDDFDALRFMLNINYRSRQPVINLANSIRKRMGTDYVEMVANDKTPGKIPNLFITKGIMQEAELVPQLIQAQLQNGVPPTEIAILYRSSSHIALIEQNIMEKGIPYNKYGGRKFTGLAHVRDFQAILRLTINSYDAIALTRVLCLIPKVGPKTAQRVMDTMKGNGISALLTCGGDNLKYYTLLYEAMSIDKNDLSNKIDVVFKTIEEFVRMAYDAATMKKRINDLKILREFANRFSTYHEFVDAILLEDPTNADETDKDKRITLSTIHSAKGREFDHVYIVSMSEGLFPSYYVQMSAGSMEEERRLFYVAVTRARKEVNMFAPVGYVDPIAKRMIKDVSPFLMEISTDNVFKILRAG
jgi:DNA helicase-2/ATP-dependent DNA helicase PcrA